MLILDTNVLSELLRPVPDDAVVEWLDAQPRAQVFTTAITRAEILYGIALLPDSSRREKLRLAAQAIFDEDLQVLSFDSQSADRYAKIATRRRAAGRPISQFDAMIAAVAHVHQASLATRNTRDFVDCEIDLVDPWAQ